MAQLNSDKVIYCHDIFIQQKGLLKNLKSTTILILRCCFKSAFALICMSLFLFTRMGVLAHMSALPKLVIYPQPLKSKSSHSGVYILNY